MSLEILRERGVSKAKFFKGKYLAKLEFPGGWVGGFQTKKTFCGEGYGYFLEPHIPVVVIIITLYVIVVIIIIIVLIVIITLISIDSLLNLFSQFVFCFCFFAGLGLSLSVSVYSSRVFLPSIEFSPK